MPHTPSYAKNVVKKSLYQLVDKMPTTDELMEMMGYFQYECAYCGTNLSNWRDVDKDHVIPSSIKGTNCIANRVPSCKPCNNEKRNTHWEEFLKKKCDSEEQYNERQQTIAWWMMTSNHWHREIPNDLYKVIEEEVERLKNEIDSSVSRIRVLKRGAIEQDAALGCRKKTRLL